MDLYLHIGQNKAASTALQDTLGFNSRELLHRGYYYPGAQISSGASGVQSGNAADLLKAVATHDVKSAETSLALFQAEVDRNECHSLVLSNESLYNGLVHPGIGCRFLKLFEHRFESVRLLVAFRQPPEHAVSAYNHRAGISVKIPFEEWVDSEWEYPREFILFIQNLYPLLAGEGFSQTSAEYALVPHQKVGAILRSWLRLDSLSEAPHNKSNVGLTCDEALVLTTLSKFHPSSVLPLRQAFKELDPMKKADDSATRATWRHLAWLQMTEIDGFTATAADLVGLPIFEGNYDSCSVEQSAHVTLTDHQLAILTQQLTPAAKLKAHLQYISKRFRNIVLS